MYTCCCASTRQGERHVCVRSHCDKKSHPEAKCWKKYAHLRPNNNKQKGLVSDANVDSAKIR